MRAWSGETSTFRKRRTVTVRSAGFCAGFAVFAGVGTASTTGTSGAAAVGLTRVFFAVAAVDATPGAGVSTTATAGPAVAGAGAASGFGAGGSGTSADPAVAAGAPVPA